MENLLSATEIAKSYSARVLFSSATIHLTSQERLGIIGPNGSGKSTLLRILAGEEEADAGDISSKKGLRCCLIPQQDSFDESATPIETVVKEVPQGESLPEVKASTALSKLGFENTDKPIGKLSGGWRKRVSIAIGLVQEAQIMLLDEPTNHLDLEAMLWLENFVRTSNISMVFVTHDRRFLENCSTRIIELANSYPEGLFEVQGDYTEFVMRKEAFLTSQEAKQAALANKVRRDTAWLRQGVQGRQTRNKTQVRDAASRRAEHKAVTIRNESPLKKAAIDFDAVGRKTNKLLACHHISKSLGRKLLFKDLDLELNPQKRIGLLGPNGSGKTTLMRLIQGDLEPDTGSIKRAHNLRVVSANQHRSQLDLNKTLQDTLCPIGEMVEYRGRTMHVSGWADRFLFTRDQLGTLVGSLSGGEHARIQIASLMLQPADILLLDEPTNDLDIPTLEVLEDSLLDFPGAVVVVTHDRFMLERISTEFLELDGFGNAKHVDDVQKLAIFRPSKKGIDDALPKRSKKREKSKSKKLTYTLQQEFLGMEKTIAKAEEVLQEAESVANDPEVMDQYAKYAEACHAVSKAQEEVARLYARWEELEEMQR